MKETNEDLVQAALDMQEGIREGYRAHEDKRPVMVFDLQEHRVYAYPYADYKATLSEQSQVMLESDYEEARQKNKIVLFVRDEATQRLVSFLLDFE